MRRAVAVLVGVAVVVVVVLAFGGVGSSGTARVNATTVGASVSATASSSTATQVPLTHRDTHGARHGHPANGPSSAPAQTVMTASSAPAGDRTGASTAADPHSLVSPGVGDIPELGPPDSTPLAAAAGTEPGEMGPLANLPAGWVASTRRFRVDGILRSYLMVRPKAVSATKLPVVVVLHGRNETPAGIERATHTPEVTGPAILLFPAGYGRSWDAGGCCGVAHKAGVNDVAFLTQTVQRVLAGQHDADPRQVYMMGFSNGGRMAYRMACADPGLLHGVAAVEAVPVYHCSRTTPLPIVIVAYSHDPLLTIYNGQPPKTMQGYREPTVQTTVDEWRGLDGCSPDGDRAVTGTATVDTWTHCGGAGRVAFALYSGGGHRWPQATLATSRRAGTPSAGDLIWDWWQHSVVVAEPPT